MRFIFVIILIAGAAVGVGYPWYVNNFSGASIGTWPVYDRVAGFQPFEARLTESDAPVRVVVDITTAGTPAFSPNHAVLTLTVNHDGKTVLHDALSFFNSSSPRDVSPQSTDKILRAEAGVLNPTPVGLYTFTAGEGDAEGTDIRNVEVTLRSDAGLVDARAQPLGFALMALGFVGFVASRSRKAANNMPKAQPSAPKWGRGGADR